MRKYLLSAVAVSAVIAGSSTAIADEAAAQKWVDQEFQPSVLSKSTPAASSPKFSTLGVRPELNRIASTVI